MGLETAFEIGQASLQIKRIADVLTASQKDVFVRLPGLVAYWPMGLRSSASVIEHSGSGHNLTQTGTCATGYDGNSFVHLGNGTNYLSNSSASFGISGLQTWVSSSLRGLTIGGWFMLDAYPATQGGLITKFGAITEYGYALYARSAPDTIFSVSSNGSALFSVASASVDLAQWYFIVGRFTPSTELAVFINGDKTVNTTAIPASINVSAQAVEIGRYLADNSKIQHGKARDVFVCAAALSDALIEEIRVTSVP